MYIIYAYVDALRKGLLKITFLRVETVLSYGLGSVGFNLFNNAAHTSSPTTFSQNTNPYKIYMKYIDDKCVNNCEKNK